MYHSKKIALFVSHIFGDYQKNVCQGVVDQAREYGFQTEIYATSDGESPGRYDAGEASVLRIPNFDDFSGIIVASGTYPVHALRDRILTTLQKTCGCPVIEIAETDTVFPSISLENHKTTGTLAEHLILVHGCRRICYAGCASERYFSDQREQIFRETMAGHDLPVGERDTFLCSYQEADAAAALDFFSDDGKDLPDAVICYNDRLALLVMAEAAKRGYQIPQDFALVGCDAIPEGQNITPKLTTVTFPSYQLGATAVLQLIKQMHGEEIPARTRIFADPVIGASCGCCGKPPENSVLFVHSLLNRIASLERSIFLSMQMSADLSHVSDIDEGMEILARYLSEIEHCSEFYICLYADWDKLSGHIIELTDEDEDDEINGDRVLLKLAVKSKKRLPECTFSKKTLLPEYINRDSAFVHIASPLFFEEREFGYMVVAYENSQVSYHLQMMHWIMNITQLLQSLCESKGSRRMLAKLESIYMRDPLTQFYNRQGFISCLPQLLAAAADGQTITALVFSMNGWKAVNDAFGRTEGEFALQAVAHTLRNALAGTDALCARFDDDMFYVLSSQFTETETAALVEQIESYLKNYNHLSTKPYTLSVSCSAASASYRRDFGPDLAEKLIHKAKSGLCADR